MGELHGGRRARALTNMRAAAWMKAVFECQPTLEGRPVLRCRRANAVSPPFGRRRVPPFAFCLMAKLRRTQQNSARGADPAGAKQQSTWRDRWGAVGRGGAQPWQLGDLLQFENTRRARAVTSGGKHRRCGVAERRRVGQHATFDASTLRTTRRAPAAFTRPRHTMMHAPQPCADLV